MRVAELRCRRCKEIKPIRSFNRTMFGKRGYDIYCHDCRTIIDEQRDGLTEKQCRHCHRMLSVNEFGRTESTRDGYYRECLDCQEENLHRRRERDAKNTWHGEMVTCTLCGMLKPTYDMNPPRFKHSKTRYCHSCISKMVQRKIQGFETDREENGWRIQKRCQACNRVKPADQFYLDRRQKDGYTRFCLACANERLLLRKAALNERRKDKKPTAMKECSICHALKPLTKFSKNLTNIDGLSLYCKTCSIQLRAENKEIWEHQRAQQPPPDSLSCTRCGRILPISMFTVVRERKKGRRSHCIDCAKIEEKIIFDRWKHQRKQSEFEISLTENTEKTCRRCGRTLSLSMFWIRAASKDGRNHYCIPCLSEKTKERNQRIKSQGFPEDKLPKMQQCSLCGRLLPRGMFWRNSTQPSGLDGRCKDCHKEYQQAYDARPDVKARKAIYQHRPEVMERARIRARKNSQRPEVKERQREYKREYKKRPYVQEKRRAYDRMRYQRPHVKAKKKMYDARPTAKARRRKSTAAWQQRKRLEQQLASRNSLGL